jgi:hypothetical protein
MSQDFAGKGTRKGVKANRSQFRLVNITNGVEIKRIRWNLAQEIVNAGGWKFCPKKFVLEVSNV